VKQKKDKGTERKRSIQLETHSNRSGSTLRVMRCQQMFQ